MLFEISFGLLFSNQSQAIVKTVHCLLVKGLLIIVFFKTVFLAHVSKIYFSWVWVERINWLVFWKHILFPIILQNHFELVFLISRNLLHFLLKQMIIRHPQAIPICVTVLKVVLNSLQNLHNFEIFPIHVVKYRYVQMNRVNQHLVVCIVQTLEFFRSLFCKSLLILQSRQRLRQNASGRVQSFFSICDDCQQVVKGKWVKRLEFSSFFIEHFFVENLSKGQFLILVKKNFLVNLEEQLSYLQVIFQLLQNLRWVLLFYTLGIFIFGIAWLDF